MDKALMRFIPKEFKKLVVDIYQGEKYWNEVTKRWDIPLVVEWENDEKSEFANKTFAWNVLKEFHCPYEYSKEGFVYP
jgi:hypothetical protein